MKRPVIILLALSLVLLAGAQTPVDRTFVGQPESLNNGLTYPLNLASVGVTLPKIIGDTQLDRRLNDPRTLFYKLEPTFQQWIPGARVEQKNLATGAVSYTQTAPVWGIYRTSVLSDFNANPDFPWEVTFGLNIAHRAGNVGPGKTYDVFNFLSLPEDDDGRLVPVTVLAGDRPVKWIFPPGTKVGEVIYVRHDGHNYVQEIRTRTKNERSTTWNPNVYRPVADLREFQALTQTAYVPSKRFMSFRNPEETLVEHVEGTVERLPSIPAEQVVKILSRPFQEVTATDWSPSPDAEFHILPKDYSFGLLKDVSADTCARCHRQTQISALNLTPLEPKLLANPAKVGSIRGCDAVFTWYPFAQRSIADKEGVVPGRFIYARAFDVQNGIVRLINRGQAPDGDVKLTRYVQDSLKDYELPQDKRYLHPVKCKCGTVCGCGEKCDCGPLVEEPRQWQPLLDNRLMVPDPGEAKASGTLRWVLGTDMNPPTRRSWLMEGDKFLGAYDPMFGVYQPYLGGNMLGAATTPPLPVPEAAKRLR